MLVLEAACRLHHFVLLNKMFIDINHFLDTQIPRTYQQIMY